MKDNNNKFTNIERAMEQEGDVLSADERFSLKKAVWDLFRIVAVAFLCFWTITFFFKPALTRGDSMVPTLHDGDLTIVRAFNYTPTHGDIVVLKDRDLDDKHLVKRVIAMAGDKVDIDFTSGVVYLNDTPLEEGYVNEPTYAKYDVDFPVVVPQGHIFVLGDNRNYSHDSRTGDMGMIPLEQLEGKVVFRYYPFDKIGVIR